MLVIVRQRHKPDDYREPPCISLDGCYDVPTPDEPPLPQVMILVVLREPLAGDQAQYRARQGVLYIDPSVSRTCAETIIAESIYRMLGLHELAPHAKPLIRSPRFTVLEGGRPDTT